MSNFNFYVLAACAALFMVAGFMCAAAAILLSGYAIPCLFSFAMSGGFLTCSGVSLHMMERY